jgi:benzoate-CoA ligase family protein
MNRAWEADRYNVSTILDANLAAGRERKAAIRWGEQELTYGDVYARACRAGRALRSLGLEREQRVLMVLDDSPAFPALFLGAVRVGAVPVPVNPMANPGDYRYFLEDSYAKALAVDAVNVGGIREALDGYGEPLHLIVVGDASETPDGFPANVTVHGFDELLAGHDDEVSPLDTHRDDMAFWLYSSGSTGRPKGVVHLQDHIPYTCEEYALPTLAITADDVTYSTTKLFHAYGLGNNLSFPYWVGATTVLRSGRPVPDAIFDTVERYRPSLFYSVPTLYNAILNAEGSAQRDFSSVRLCVSAAEALPAEVWRRWHKTYDLVILDGIGSTELLHIFCTNTVGDVVPGSSGKPAPGYELKLLDFDGQPTKERQTGNLYVKGGSAFQFYWHQREKTAQTVLGDWIATGDRYRCDEDSHYWYEGRADDMMKVGGLWVSPIEIENTLIEHEAVAEAAVVSVTVDKFARIKAFVVCRSGSTPSDDLKAELQAWCKGHLQRYQYPHIVAFVDELPKTLTGKIQRFKLRDAS